jgi:hypothetical protein
MAKRKNVHAVYWQGASIENCDIESCDIVDKFFDARIQQGGWAILCEACFKKNTLGTLGLDLGQKYEKQPDGRWLKTEG